MNFLVVNAHIPSPFIIMPIRTHHFLVKPFGPIHMATGTSIMETGAWLAEPLT